MKRSYQGQGFGLRNDSDVRRKMRNVGQFLSISQRLTQYCFLLYDSTQVVIFFDVLFHFPLTVVKWDYLFPQTSSILAATAFDESCNHPRQVAKNITKNCDVLGIAKRNENRIIKYLYVGQGQLFLPQCLNSVAKDWQ